MTSPRLAARTLALLSLALCAPLAAPPRASAAPDAGELRVRYQTVYLRAEDALAGGRLLEAIRIYEDSIASLDGYGGAHLRLAQLYQMRVDETADPAVAASLVPFVAFHFLRCAQDQRLDELMRDTVCGAEVRQRLSPLLVKGAPARLEVMAPRPFVGPTPPGALLPIGEVPLRVQLSPTSEPISVNARLPLREPLDLSEEAFMPARPRLDLSDGLVSSPPPVAPMFVEPPEVKPLSVAPGFVMLGAGLAVVGGGVLALTKGSDCGLAIYFADQCPNIIIGVGSALSLFGLGWLAFAW